MLKAQKGGSLPAVMEAIARLRGGAKETVCMFRLRADGGEERWMEARCRRSRPAGPAGRGFVVWVARDVTAHKRKEQALEAEKQRLEVMVGTDALTGLANRRRFDEVRTKEWRRACREETAISLLVVDVDHFKRYNDTYGHAEGDRCLAAVAGVIAASMRRPADFCARHGGEEFVVLLPRTDGDGARHVGEAIRAGWIVLPDGRRLRPDEVDKLAPLWLSVLLATALGQLFAHLRVRLWLAVFLVVNGMWLFPLLAIHALQQMSNPWPAVEIFLLAFAPGTLCAYLSMSERGGLVAFWFPAALWMLSILDRSEDTALSGPLSWVLLTALAALMLASFRLQEARRIAVWQGHATARLAAARPPVILRRTPLRQAAQLAWIVTLAAATLGSVARAADPPAGPAQTPSSPGARALLAPRRLSR